MASQIITKALIVLAMIFAANGVSANALDTAETANIVAQLKALYEVEGNRTDRCEYLVNHRPHYQKVLILNDEMKL